MNKKIIFITGGARSGKSSFALREAEKLKGKKAYIATAEALDEDMRERIEKHKLGRGKEWTTFEEPIKIAGLISKIDGEYDVILLDCLTLWLSNLLTRKQHAEDRAQNAEHRTQSEEEIEQFIDALKLFKKSSVCGLNSELCALFIVSNEVGMGIVPENKLARQFRDLAGMLNQKIAGIADEVYILVSGIPLQVKGQSNA